MPCRNNTNQPRSNSFRTLPWLMFADTQAIARTSLGKTSVITALQYAGSSASPVSVRARDRAPCRCLRMVKNMIIIGATSKISLYVWTARRKTAIMVLLTACQP